MLSPTSFVICGAVLCGISGLPHLLARSAPRLGQVGAASILLTGSVIGTTGALRAVFDGRPESYLLEWSLPFGPAALGLDPLSAIFALLIFILSGCCSLYGIGYWPAEKRGLSFFFGILSAALVMVVLARNGILFLLAWEIMALANYILLTSESDRPEVCEAGKAYLISTHLATLAIFALFSIIRTATGSFHYPEPAALSAISLPATAIFATAILGFGLKAGIMPLHVWLPGAHANAPSHISALMSGVVIKMGIYGLMRTLTFFSQIPLWWGIFILIAGIVSGLLGVIFAIAQHDIKRLLAYHSIENIGIITMGIGLAIIGQTTGAPALIILGLGGALLHVLNHGIFKSLLFLGAGAVIHASGTREIDRMGGLARTMPITSIFFLTGAIAICGLPPLNGFVSEFLIYLGCFTGIREGFSRATPILALAVPSLAMIGGLALACFVKVFGAAFLGLSRKEGPQPHEPCLPMLAPMGLLAILCLAIGCFPAGATRFLEPAIRPWVPASAGYGINIAGLAPMPWLSTMALALAAVLLLLGLLYRRKIGTAVRGTTGTWDCGYAAPGTRMQYSSSSFAEMLVKLFDSLLRPRMHLPSIKGFFPVKTHFASHVPEVVLELIVIPLFRRADRRMSTIRLLQHGQLHLYILYVFLTLLLLLAWGA